MARYGEDQAHTFEARKYPQGFRYRDWLIKAFNDDMPYDRFVMEQIAGRPARRDPDRLENLPALWLLRPAGRSTTATRKSSTSTTTASTR